MNAISPSWTRLEGEEPHVEAHDVAVASPVGVPVQPDRGEAQGIREHLGQHAREGARDRVARRPLRQVRQAELDDEQRDRDREDGIREEEHPLEIEPGVLALGLGLGA